MQSLQQGNFYRGAQAPASGERFDTLLAHRNLTIERIASTSKITSQLYLQAQDEWVLLVQGEALLDVAGQPVPLAAGDYLFLPAQTPHTLLRVSDGALWLAVHLAPQA